MYQIDNLILEIENTHLNLGELAGASQLRAKPPDMAGAFCTMVLF